MAKMFHQGVGQAEERALCSHTMMTATITFGRPEQLDHNRGSHIVLWRFPYTGVRHRPAPTADDEFKGNVDVVLTTFLKQRWTVRLSERGWKFREAATLLVYVKRALENAMSSEFPPQDWIETVLSEGVKHDLYDPDKLDEPEGAVWTVDLDQLRERPPMGFR